MDDGRVVRAGAIQVFPVESRWQKDRVLGVQGYPWAPTGTLRRANEQNPEVPAPAVVSVEGHDHEPVPRGMPVLPKHLSKFGYSERCRKCKAMLEGDTSQPTLGHSEVCRMRIRQLAKGDEEFGVKAEAAERRTRRKPEEEGKEQDERKRATTRGGSDEHGQGERSGTQEQQPTAAPTDEPVVPAEGKQDLTRAKSDDILVPTMDEVDSVPLVQVRSEPEEVRRQIEPEPKRARIGSTSGPADNEERAREHSKPSLKHVCMKSSCGTSVYDVCELFSPPRVCKRALERGMRGGWSLDLSSEDPVTNKKWDLSCSRAVARVKAMIRRDRPRLIITSPPCTMFSLLQNLSGGPDERKLKEAAASFETAIDFSMYQAKLGGFFVIEHPQTSRAWKLPCTGKLLEVNGLVKATFNMCHHGMRAQDEHGVGYASKPTTILTNSAAIAEKVYGKCPGNHRHVHLVSGRAKAAAIYPVGLCDAFLNGIAVEMAAGGEQRQRELMAMSVGDDMCDKQDYYNDHEDIEEIKDKEAWKWWKMIEEARKKEMTTFHSILVYE